MAGSSRTIFVDPPGELREVDIRACAAADRAPRRRWTSSPRGARQGPRRPTPRDTAGALRRVRGAGRRVRPAEAAVSYYAGQLRARYDATRCTDPSAAAALGLLRDRYGEPVNRWAFADPRRVRRAAVDGRGVGPGRAARLRPPLDRPARHASVPPGRRSGVGPGGAVAVDGRARPRGVPGRAARGTARDSRPADVTSTA